MRIKKQKASWQFYGQALGKFFIHKPTIIDYGKFYTYFFVTHKDV